MAYHSFRIAESGGLVKFLVGVLFYIVDTVVAHFEHPEIRSGWSAPRPGECLVLLRPRQFVLGLRQLLQVAVAS